MLHAAPDIGAGLACYLAVPLDLGGPGSGAALGPHAVWQAIRERVERRRGDPDLAPLRAPRRRVLDLPGRLDLCRDLDAPLADVHRQPAYLAEVARSCQRVADAVAEEAARASAPLLVVGGDHSMAIGTVAGLRRALGRVGVLWIDAHADLNVWQESPSGRVHGMAAAAVLGRPGTPEPLLALAPDGRGLPPAHLAYLGLRDLDAGEKAYLRARPEVLALSMDDVEAEGIARLAERIVAHFERLQLDAVHVSLDVDALEPAEAPGTGVPVSGGLREREVLYLLGALRRARASGRAPFRSLEIAEVNPALDQGDRTAALAARLACRFLGEDPL